MFGTALYNPSDLQESILKLLPINYSAPLKDCFPREIWTAPGPFFSRVSHERKANRTVDVPGRSLKGFNNDDAKGGLPRHEPAKHGSSTSLEWNHRCCRGCHGRGAAQEEAEWRKSKSDSLLLDSDSDCGSGSGSGSRVDCGLEGGGALRRMRWDAIELRR
jgi:hypothetical protein